MARDWQPGVYPKPPAKGPYWVKFKVWERRDMLDAWQKKKGFRTRAEARAYGDRQKDTWRRKEAGLWNETEELARMPIGPFIDEFEQHVKLGLRKRIRRRESGHALSIRQMLERVVESTGVRTVGDLSGVKVTNWMASLRSKLKPSTLNAYRGMVTRFGQWLEDRDIVLKSPFRGMVKVPVDEEDHRQAHTTETIVKIAHAAVERVRCNSRGKTRMKSLPIARHRALIYLLSFLTSMRSNAMANAKWSWFDGEAGCLTIPAEWVKRPGKPRAQVIPLHSELAKLLQEVRRERGVQRGRPVADDELVVGKMNSKGFAVLPDRLPEVIRMDAKFIGIESPDKDGRVLDVVALRTSCASELRRAGVMRPIVSEIMHTGRQSIADRHYIKVGDEVMRELRGFMDRLPFKAEDVRGLLFDIQPEPVKVAGPRKGPDSVRISEHERSKADTMEKKHAT